MPAWLFSVIVHTLLTITVLMLGATTPKGIQPSDDRPIGLAIAMELPDRTVYEPVQSAGEEGDISGDASTGPSDSDAALPSAAEVPMEIQDLLGQASAPLASTVGSIGASTVAANGDSSGRGRSAKGGNQSPTTMFGITSVGQRFVYCFDRSESMNGYQRRPLFVAKRELLTSIEMLKKDQEFQIVFYNQQAVHLSSGKGQPMRMLRGDDRDRATAKYYIQQLDGSGSTNHLDAIKMALRMSPDVIYLLTDARQPRLSRVQMEDIYVRATKSETTIHCIEFGSDPVEPSDTFLRELAQQNGGQYRYLDVTKLGGDIGPIDPNEEFPR
jgi:hypothetical protein